MKKKGLELKLRKVGSEKNGGKMESGTAHPGLTHGQH